MRRSQVAVAGAAALGLVLVALAARPDAAPLLAPASAGAVRHVLTDALFYLGLAVLLLFLGVCVWALWPDPEAPELPPPERRSWLWLLAPILAAGAAALILPRLRLRPLQPNLPAPAGGAGPLGLTPPGGGGGSGGVDWIALALVLGILAAGLLVAWLRLRRPARRGRPAWRLAAALEEVFDDAVDDVLAERDPRRAVIAAYARMERVLAAHGLPRRAAEAPLEYVGRAGAALEPPLALQRLAELYEWARFSPHEVAEAMRGEALEALLAIRDQLRELRARREHAVAV